LVNHCVNDILVQGARPLFFLDYVASSRLLPEQIAAVVGGVAAACKAVGCALLGGETAEMPGVYEAGELDLAGTIVGVVERGQIVDGAPIRPGDAILALPSTGLHTNGYSLARRVLAELDWNAPMDALGTSVGDALLAVHRSYLDSVRALWAANVEIRGMAHITGGGVIDNLPRVLPEDTGAQIRRGSWAVPPIFDLIQELGGVSEDEMFHVFNMGLGMLIVVPPAQAAPALALLPDAALVGEIVAGDGSVSVRG
jgi:phosphoribosylformylglycinamidine cyclo-ligase